MSPLFSEGSVVFSFWLAVLLYDTSIENAFVYIGGNNPTSGITGEDKLIYFWIAAIPSMIFSPIGEEFLYRGVIHGSFVSEFGETKASVFDSLAFALNSYRSFWNNLHVWGMEFLPIPAVLWLCLCFLLVRCFSNASFFCNSIWGAVAAYSGFNFVMMYCIFYLL